MFMKYLLLVFFTSLIECQIWHDSSRTLCPYPNLANGRPRLRQRWRMVRFSCSLGFELVGNRYATCRNGQWDVPMPVCVKSGCDIPSVEKGIVMLAHHEAWLHAFCLPGYTLKGASTLYCNGVQWNGTVPECVETSAKPKLSCDFEDEDLCGWTQDEYHDFDWKRINRKTPSAFLFTGPSYDHTTGRGGNGYYMYIESTSRAENDTARLLSPVYSADVAYDACFVFYYHMYGRQMGGLRVYQKPDSMTFYNASQIRRSNYMLFEVWGNQNDFWYGAVTPLKNYSAPFQIIIEGIRGPSFTSDIAIDDVAILYGENCTDTAKYMSTPPTPPPDSCVGRCDFSINVNSSGNTGCSCNFVLCLSEENCCPDFMDLCVYNNANSKQDDDTTPNSRTSPELPQTEKLIGANVTTRRTTPITSPAPSSTVPETTSRESTTPPYLKSTTPQETNATIRPKTSATTTSKPIRATTESSTTSRPVKATSSRTMKSTSILKPSTPYIVVNITTSEAPVTSSKASSTIYYKKDAIVDAITPSSESVKVVSEISSKTNWSAINILIAAICIGCCCGLTYAVVALRSTRGRIFITRILGSARQDPEVRYLNTDSNIDED